MLENRKKDETSKSLKNGFVNARVVAVIAACAAVGSSLGSAAFNYFFTERQRTEIQADALQVQKASQLVSEAAQRTAEELKNISAARLQLENQVALLNASRESFRDQIARVGGLNDSRRTDNDAARTRAGLAKLRQELVPQVTVKCDGRSIAEYRIDINCQFKNIGSHTLFMKTESITLVDTGTRDEVPGAILKVSGDDKNKIVPSGDGGNLFVVSLRLKNSEVVGKTFRLHFIFDTDASAVSEYSAATGRVLTPAQVKELTNYGFIFNLNWN
jgi:hypothetical protein